LEDGSGTAGQQVVGAAQPRAQEAPLAKIRIFGDDDEGVFGRVLPDGLVVRSFQPNVATCVEPV